jgi:hypothetical protein
MIIEEGKETMLYNRSNRRMQTTVRPILILVIHYSIIVWKDCLEILLHFSYKAHENDEDLPPPI